MRRQHEPHPERAWCARLHIRVRMLLHMRSLAMIHISASYYISHVLILLYTYYVSSVCILLYVCLRGLLCIYQRPHTAYAYIRIQHTHTHTHTAYSYISSVLTLIYQLIYYDTYIRMLRYSDVLILLYIYDVSSVCILPDVCLRGLLCIYLASAYSYISSVLILLHVCPRAILYVSAYSYISSVLTL
jgi:hypothetical protein